VLIVAPSGAGKSNLLQQWCQMYLAISLIPPLYFDLKSEHNRPKLFLDGLLTELGIGITTFQIKSSLPKK
jgi:ATP/maltotriose-dependent transcriptional regulator MalT